MGESWGLTRGSQLVTPSEWEKRKTETHGGGSRVNGNPGKWKHGLNLWSHGLILTPGHSLFGCLSGFADVLFACIPAPGRGCATCAAGGAIGGAARMGRARRPRRQAGRGRCACRAWGRALERVWGHVASCRLVQSDGAAGRLPSHVFFFDGARNAQHRRDASILAAILPEQ